MVEIIFVVGDDFYCSGRFETADKIVEIFGIDEASFLLASFRPGVGEIDVETFDGLGREIFFYKDSGIGANNSDVGEVPSSDAVEGIAIESAGIFDAEQIYAGERPGVADEEGAFAGADFHLERCRTSEKLVRSDGACEIQGVYCKILIVL